MKTQDRTIRDVKIGDIVEEKGVGSRVADVGKYGFAFEEGDYYTFDEAEGNGFTLKQPEKQEIEKLDYLNLIREETYMNFSGNKSVDENLTNKLNEVIEVVNKLIKEI